MVAHRLQFAGIRFISALVLFACALITLCTVWPSVVFADDGVRGEQGYAIEVQGALYTQGDMHIFGVQPDVGASTVVLTLAYQIPEESLVRDGLVMYAMQQDGLVAYLGGAPLSDSIDMTARAVVANHEGMAIQLELSPDSNRGYTVIVANTWFAAANYQLAIHGGTLIDEGGQTLVGVSAEQPVQAVRSGQLVRLSSTAQARQFVELPVRYVQPKSILEMKAAVRRPSIGAVPIRSASTEMLRELLPGFVAVDVPAEP